MVEVYRICLSRCKGLVAFVVQGRTWKYQWTCTPALLIADLHRAGICVREPLYFHRSGIPGSGGPDDMRHDLEYIVRATNGGRLPWSDNIACGEPPKFKPGGNESHRTQNGNRVQNKKNASSGLKIANPGNIIHCSGGHLGSKLAHENEAPFPEKLAEFFIKSFCPPGGIVLDPFLGSGTTCAVAKKLGRRYIGVDIRQSQIELTQRRLNETI